ncbi:MAG: heavy-metal-associated domain-containing protein [Flavobacteriales bacterium]|nr:heavy-metal-associated domain-containing protein [Flavobacteriales bacterium]
MTQTYSINGIMCNGCAGHVKEQIEKHPNVTQVDVSATTMNLLLRPKEAIISMNQHIPISELQLFLDKDSEYSGKYSISQAD